MCAKVQRWSCAYSVALFLSWQLSCFVVFPKDSKGKCLWTLLLLLSLAMIERSRLLDLSRVNEVKNARFWFVEKENRTNIVDTLSRRLEIGFSKHNITYFRTVRLLYKAHDLILIQTTASTQHPSTHPQHKHTRSRKAKVDVFVGVVNSVSSQIYPVLQELDNNNHG